MKQARSLELADPFATNIGCVKSVPSTARVWRPISVTGAKPFVTPSDTKPFCTQWVYCGPAWLDDDSYWLFWRRGTILLHLRLNPTIKYLHSSGIHSI